MNPRPIPHYDVVIVGAGPAGLCFARSLAGTGLQIALVEGQEPSALAEPAFDGREIALTQLSARLLRELDVWRHLPAEEIAPLRIAQVRDGRSSYALRFAQENDPAGELGHLVSNHLIRRAAFAAVRTQPQVELIAPTRVVHVRSLPDHAELSLADGRLLTARLVVAADSRFSETRRAMGIPASMHDFGKTMLVCRMAHELPHDGTASEWFDYGATLATLPMNGQRSSVVLTLPAREIEALRRTAAADFARDIEQRLQRRLGAMELIGERFAYPLVAVWAEHFVAQRYALIGDAAVGMHPVTAHGFNLGLRGQDSLAREIRTALTRGIDIADAAVLARYQSAHRRASRPLYLATNAIVKLYTDDRLPARLARSAALRIGGRLAPFRKAVVATLTDAAS